MTLPHIGITTSLNDGEQRLDRAYVVAIEAAGGLPLIVPMLETDEAADAFADLIDGLVVTGGPAISQGLVGSLPDEINETDPVRLRSDSRLLGRFMDADRPALGICYGMQLASALRGGTIYADVERQAQTAVHSEKRGGPPHRVDNRPGSHLARLLGPSVTVNTRHLQAIERPGEGLRATAHAPDGVIEGIETVDGSFLGVQFHPEKLGSETAALFTHLVEQARSRAAAR